MGDSFKALSENSRSAASSSLVFVSISDFRAVSGRLSDCSVEVIVLLIPSPFFLLTIYSDRLERPPCRPRLASDN
jgi:hypothetical protein